MAGTGDMLERLRRSMGKFPQQLEGHEGREVQVYSRGRLVMEGTLHKGPYSYVVEGSDGKVQLYVGWPAVVKTPEGEEIVDLGRIQL